MLFDPASQLRPRKRNIIFVVGHHQASHLLANSIRQTDDAQFFHVRRVLIDLFELVRINVLAVGIDNDFFGASDEEEIAVVIEFSQIAGIEPTLNERWLYTGELGKLD